MAAFLPSTRRRVLLVPIVAVHAGVLAWVAGGRLPVPVRQPAQATLMLVDVAAPVAPPAASPSARVAPMRPVVAPAPIVEVPALDATVPVAVAVADATPIAPGGCDLTDVVQTALRGSAVVGVAVARLPADARSVANAVMLWDGRWAEPRGTAERQTVREIRAVVRDTVASASEECRVQPQAGPRLIALAGSPELTLALGSGRWRWGDLMNDADMPGAVAVAGAAKENSPVRASARPAAS